VLPAIAFAGAAVALWPWACDAIRRHPYFALTEVVVRDARRLTADEVRHAAGIEPGMSVWDVDERAAETRLRRYEWVRSARVRRELPHRVTIHVREERPVAIVVTDKGEEHYVSARAHVFARLRRGDPRDLPSITGVPAPDGGRADPAGSRAFRRALLLVRRANGLVVSEVHVDRVRGLTLMPVSPAIPIELGWNGFDEKLRRFARVMALWAGRENEIAGVSLLFDDEVIVRSRATAKRRTT
jgi:cell division protein FtsQ